MKRLLTALLLLTLTVVLASSAFAADAIEIEAQIAQIKSYGNVVLPLSGAEMTEAGYSFGDTVDVTFGEQTVTMPYCTNFSDVDSGCPALVWHRDKDYHQLAIFNGDFASAYAFAEKTDDGWFSEKGDSIPVIISMNTPMGYYEEYVIRSIAYTDERADYPQLTDAEYANFREITTPGIPAGTLFRCASPLNDKHNRAFYAADAIEAVGIRVILNLADSDSELSSYESYSDSYYASAAVIALQMGMDFSSEENMQKMAVAMRFILANEGPVCVHCLEGKDRTGIVCAVLELLAGASLDDIRDDYMTTYANYYGITEDDEAYDLIFGSFEKNLRLSLGDNLSAEDYLLRCGLEPEEIRALIQRLT